MRFPFSFWKPNAVQPPAPPEPPQDGLALWIQADRTDQTENGPLSIWPELAQGNDFAQDDESKQPALSLTGGPNGRACVTSDGVASTMRAGPSFPLRLPTGDFSFICVVKTQPGRDNFPFAHQQFDLGYAQRIYGNGHISFYQGTDVPPGIGWTDLGSLNISDGNWHILIARRVGGVLVLMIDGIADTVVPTNYRVSFYDGTYPWIPARNGAAAGGAMELFTYAGNNFSACSIYALMGYAETVKTSEQLRALSQQYADYCGIALSGDAKKFILFDGNSLVYGQGSTSPSPPTPPDATGNDMPSQVMRILGLDSYAYLNGGVNGFTTDNIKDGLANRLALTLNHGGAACAYVFSEGINSAAADGLTPEQAIESLQDLCQKVFNMFPDMRIIVCTITPWAPGGSYITTVEEMETWRQAYNQMIRDTTINDWWQAVVDVGADAQIGVPGANLNEDFYTPDHTHMINAGYAVFAGLVEPVLNAQLNQE